MFFTKLAIKNRIRHVRRVARFLSFEKLKRVLECLVLTKIEFGMQFYAKTKTVYRIIQPLIMEAARLALKSSVTDHLETSTVLARVGWLNAENMARLARISAMRQLTLNRNCPFTMSFFEGGAQRLILASVDFRDRVLPNNWPVLKESCKKSFLYMSVSESRSIRLYGANIPDNISERSYIKDEILSKWPNGKI